MQKPQQLWPSDIGVLDNHLCGVWHNWNCISIKNIDGEELFSWKSTKNLIHEAKIIGENYLFISFGAGISVFNFQVYDFKKRQWSPVFPVETCDYIISGVQSEKPMLSIINNNLTEIWDIVGQPHQNKISN